MPMKFLAVPIPTMIAGYVLIFSCIFFFVITESAATPCYTSIFAFGDSLTDNGNLLLFSAPRIIHQGCLPNGETYFHHPTGRCCDGRLIIDFLAQHFGLPIPPPFAACLKNNASNIDIHTGVNFAVAGARALDTSYYDEIGISGSVTNASLRVQIGWFKDLLPSFCRRITDCKKQLKSSFVLLGPFGGNDYRYALFDGVNMEAIQLLAHEITTAVSIAVSELIELGVGTVMVPGLVPDGCLAVSLTYFGRSNKDTGCMSWLNSLAEFHNNLLQERLNLLRKRYSHANIIYADYFNAVMELYASPEKYGFKRSFAACCGAGGPYNYNKEVQCGDPLTEACSDPSVYINWDGPHFTEAANRWITNALLEGPFTYPHIPSSCILETQTSKHLFARQAI